MTSRQFNRPGRKHLRHARVMREPRALNNVWRNAFVSLCLVGIATYALSISILR